MVFDFRFRGLQDESEVLDLENFLRLQSLGYPNYQDWVNKAKEEILSGYKKVILAFSEGCLVGDLIFQSHKQLRGLLELKNLRVDSWIRGRYFGSFLLRQAEIEARKFGQGALICDTHSDNLEVNSLLRFCGYQELVRVPLYENNKEEIIYIKPLIKGVVLI
ncbi:MAG: GNAT family N-acetyltransferase [Nanoarchaeota archaeon]|nr:GNAT family N-acetyltransferase [Nanoarchaeota archaeon]MBU1027490.1 GNAT family N-acetyltransferase [Nanoarchaeota archaeon]